MSFDPTKRFDVRDTIVTPTRNFDNKDDVMLTFHEKESGRCGFADVFGNITHIFDDTELLRYNEYPIFKRYGDGTMLFNSHFYLDGSCYVDKNKTLHELPDLIGKTYGSLLHIFPNGHIFFRNKLNGETYTADCSSIPKIVNTTGFAATAIRYSDNETRLHDLVPTFKEESVLLLNYKPRGYSLLSQDGKTTNIDYCIMGEKNRIACYMSNGELYFDEESKEGKILASADKQIVVARLAKKGNITGYAEDIEFICPCMIRITSKQPGEYEFHSIRNTIFVCNKNGECLAAHNMDDDVAEASGDRMREIKVLKNSDRKLAFLLVTRYSNSVDPDMLMNGTDLSTSSFFYDYDKTDEGLKLRVAGKCVVRPDLYEDNCFFVKHEHQPGVEGRAGILNTQTAEITSMGGYEESDIISKVHKSEEDTKEKYPSSCTGALVRDEYQNTDLINLTTGKFIRDLEEKLRLPKETPETLKLVILSQNYAVLELNDKFAVIDAEGNYASETPTLWFTSAGRALKSAKALTSAQTEEEQDGIRRK